MRDTMLFLHILGAATWFGASLTIFIVVPRMRAAGHKGAGPFMGVYEKTSNMIYAPAAVLLLVTGVWLVIDSSFWDWDQAFVSIGFLAVIVRGGLSAMQFGPLAEKAALASTGGDAGGVQAAPQRTTLFTLVDTGIVVITLVGMVAKWGL